MLDLISIPVSSGLSIDHWKSPMILSLKLDTIVFFHDLNFN